MYEQHLDYLQKYDPQIYKQLILEKERQMDGLELIPSENLVSQAVLEAMGSVATNKYSEGYPHKRYYGGNEFIDIERLKKLFGAEHANVQPLSGSPANMAAYMAVMQIGDTAMGLKLTEGGHLTHGHKVNFSGKLFNFVQYGVDEKTELLDYDAILKQAKETKPKLILSGYTAYPRKIDFKRFREICDDVGAVCMADIAHIAGLCCTGVHENPVPYFDIVTTTTHKTMRGPRGAVIMCKKDFAERVDKSVFPGMQGGPHDHITAAKAVALKEALEPSFRDYARQIVKNSKALAETLMGKGWRLVTNGTDNHLMLVDVFSKGLTGKEAEHCLEVAGIYCNKNTIPFDKRSPFDPSGIRIGTPVMTTRGMKESDMKEVGSFIDRALKAKDKEAELKKIKADVKEFCKDFRFYK